MKIVITGGLGYIGHELCKLYSGTTRHNDITVIDNRFLASSVSQLSKWGIKFIHGDILDEALMREVLKDADVVIHLSGITDVAYIKTQANDEKDFKIRQVGIEGTRNIIKHCTGKLIFPSTHVVFEGVNETEQEISECRKPETVLTYSETKAQSEYDIERSVPNHIILRLGSVYGYSDSDSMRINIMPNLFSKIASQGGKISLFGKGVQYKSLVALKDVARCMKFFAENDLTGTYHLSNENTTVKEVATICSNLTGCELVETDDEIPNLGYTLSNDKLLATGFEFKHNLQDCIIEMISKWKAAKAKPEEYKIYASNVFTDSRGEIANYDLPEPINLLATISRKKGTIAANHYHPIQEQKCLLISGKYISVTKDINGGVLSTRLINSGNLAVIQPNVAHAMVFLEDSVFLNLVNGDRDSDNNSEHTIPYELVDDKLLHTLMNYYRLECRVCGCNDLKDVISLGLSPLANNLLDSPDECDKYPLELKHCPKCHNVQLSIVVPPQEMFDNYLYVSSTSAVFRKHFEDAAEQYVKEFNLTSDSLVVDIGSNDGVFLKPLLDKGVKVIGIEAAKNIATNACNEGIATVNSYFDESCVDFILNSFCKADLITASNVFAHADYLRTFAKDAFMLLKKEGTFIIEVQYLIDTIIDCTFDNIYHEHVNYWSITALDNLCDMMGIVLYKVEHIDTHGGSIRAYMKRNGEQEQSVKDYLQKEELFFSKKPLKSFADAVEGVKRNVLTNINALKEFYPHLAGYGSPAKATTALNFFGIDSSIIEHTWEDNELKIGKFIPGVNIPIKKQIADMFIVLAWNFFDDIKSRNPDMPMISIKDLHLPPAEFANKFLPQPVHY